MEIRAVAVDIDGTVTDMRKKLYWSAVEGLRHVEAQGIPVIPATGNVMPVTVTFSGLVGLSGPLVCENGGVAYRRDLTAKKVLHKREPAERALKHLLDEGFDARPLWSDAFRESEVAIETNLDVEEVQKALADWDLNVVTTRFAIHLMEHGLDKRNGLEAALDLMGADFGLESVLAIGDSRNDVEMLEACGASATVANAMESAKAVSQFHASADHGDGVAEALRHFGLVDSA